MPCIKFNANNNFRPAPTISPFNSYVSRNVRKGVRTWRTRSYASVSFTRVERRYRSSRSRRDSSAFRMASQIKSF